MDEAWLASLPRDDEALAASDDWVMLTALLVPGPVGRVRLLVWPLYLEFDAEDVIEISEIAQPPELRLEAAIAVEVRLRFGASLLALHSPEALPVAALGGPLPFALATRPRRLVLPPLEGYTATTADYLRRHGLDPYQ
jgi:hypothetical protein